MFAGREGTRQMSCIEAEPVVAFEVVAVAREASRAVRSTDTVTATPSAPNKRPAAHVESDTPRSPQATAGQLHRGASRSNAGPNRLRRKTADRPAKLIRTPARAADAAPGAVDPSRSTSATDAPAGSRSAAFRGPSLTGMTRTPSLTWPGWYATAPYRSTPTAAGCTTSPGRRTWWPRPASRRSPPGGTSPQPRSANGWSGCMRSPPVPVFTAPVPAKAEVDATSRARPDTDAPPQPGTLTAPVPAPAARTRW